MTPLLQSDRIKLRPPRKEDLDDLYDIENDTAAWIYNYVRVPFTRRSIERFLENYTPNAIECKYIRFMVELKATAQCIGIAELFDVDWMNRRAEVGIYIVPEARHQGVASECLNILARYAAKHLGMNRLYAYVHQDNEYSKHLFAGCGYQDIATLPGWLARGPKSYDLHLFHLPLC